MVDAPRPWRVFDAPTGGPVPAGDPASPGPTAPDKPPAARTLFATLAILAAALLVGVAGVALAAGFGQGQIVDSSTTPAADGSPSSDLVVSVTGAVAHPGLYRLPHGSRVRDAIDSAGGFSPRVAVEAVAARLNLAAQLDDGAQVRVPSRDDPAAIASTPAGQGVGGSSLVELNHASQSELESLPGIGPVTAGKIVESRQTAPFRSVDELRERGLVGEKTFAKIRALVTVG